MTRGLGYQLAQPFPSRDPRGGGKREVKKPGGKDCPGKEELTALNTRGLPRSMPGKKQQKHKKPKNQDHLRLRQGGKEGNVSVLCECGEITHVEGRIPSLRALRDLTDSKGGELARRKGRIA